MATQSDFVAEPRVPLSRDRVLQAAVDLADKHGIESVSMRRLGQELGVEAMSLYNHVANKEDLLDGMVDLVMSEVELTTVEGDWKKALRTQILSARDSLLNHPWAPSVIESRTNISPAILVYLESAIGILRDGGLSLDLIHHGMHALGSRLMGFSQEIFSDSDTQAETPEETAFMLDQMSKAFPNMGAMMEVVKHEDDSVVGSGCDDSFEFVFALDILLDGLDRLKDTP